MSYCDKINILQVDIVKAVVRRRGKSERAKKRKKFWKI
jgi:hypothetical protein